MITSNNKELFSSIRLRFLFKDKITGAWGSDPKEGNAISCIRAADLISGTIKHVTSDLTLRSYSQQDIEKRSLKEGDILIEKSGGGENQPVGRVALFSIKEKALCSNFLQVLRPDIHILFPKFGAYLLLSIWLKRVVVSNIKQTTGIQNLDINSYLDISVDIPSLDTQQKVAAYLDKETDYLNNLIQAKEQMIKLLKEKRMSLITRTVTKGLNPNAKMKASGIDWLGEIPDEWEIEKARWLFSEKNDRSVTGEEELLTVSHITGVTPRSEKKVYMFEADSKVGYKIATSGDLVINTLWAWMGAMGTSPIEGIVSPAYHVYKIGDRLMPEYVDLMVRLRIFAQEVTRFSKGVWSSRLRLYPEGFYEVFFPVPKISEQKKIVSYLKEQSIQVQKMIDVAEKSINLLKERRAALISAAVTGQIEIP